MMQGSHRDTAWVEKADGSLHAIQYCHVTDTPGGTLFGPHLWDSACECLTQRQPHPAAHMTDRTGTILFFTKQRSSRDDSFYFKILQQSLLPKKKEPVSASKYFSEGDKSRTAEKRASKLARRHR